MPVSFQSSLDTNIDMKTAMILHRTENANIPVILTAPHGGPLRFGNQNITARPLLPGIVTRGDLHTMELLIMIDDYVRRRTCNERRPHIVAARFHRQFIDANRNSRIPSHVAYHPGCSIAKNLYDQYHNLIDNCVTHSIDSSPFARTLLLDIHGMGPYSDYVVVGTLNGQTCATVGPESVSQPHMGFLWHLRRILGSSVLPFPGCKDFPQYSGGHTVGRHGGGRVDALQLEFGGFLRTLELRQQIAEAVGEAILRTIQPMRIFLQTLALFPSIQWRAVDIPLVENKLKKARFLTPADIIQRLATINKVLESQGAKKFSKKTLRIIMEMFNIDSISISTFNSNQNANTLINSNQYSNININQKNNYYDVLNQNSLPSTSLSSTPLGDHLKLLPKEFLLLYHQKIFTSIPFNFYSLTSCFLKNVSGNILSNILGNIPVNDQGDVTTLSDSNINSISSYYFNSDSHPDESERKETGSFQISNINTQSHQLNIVRRIFIYDKNEYFNGYINRLNYHTESGKKILSSTTSIPVPISSFYPKTISNIYVDEENEDYNLSSSPSTIKNIDNSVFSMDEFLFGGEVTSSSLAGFIYDGTNCSLGSRSKSSELCARTGDIRDTVDGYMVTFPNLPLFSTKLHQWQDHMNNKYNDDNNKNFLAIIPILSKNCINVGFHDRIVGDNIADINIVPKEKLNGTIVEIMEDKDKEKEKKPEKEKEKERIKDADNGKASKLTSSPYSSEEYLYTAYVFYQGDNEEEEEEEEEENSEEMESKNIGRNTKIK